MIGGSTPEALAARFTAVAHQWVAEGPGERTERARRKLLSAIAANEPATLNDVAKVVGRGAPAVSRSVDALVRTGLVERTQDPKNRRRLALKLTQQGRDQLTKRIAGGPALRGKLERLAQSELRALERAIEILERGI
jgi:DNA-binding MarR family transcriptional regulator